MNILIVDDNSNNRMILNLLLERFAEENRLSYDIQECVNGLEALNRVKEKKYDLIFMDIMMPVMDGIEATKKIREIDHEVMIIAVSAVDDDAKQKEILRNGAEDYVPKPIDAEQLFSRLENYFSLLSLRHKEVHGTNSKSVNLFTHKIYHRQTIFYVENEEALAEFWEFYLLRDESLKLDGLSDVVRAVFAVGEAIVKLSEKPWIIVETDDEAHYFTINKIESIGDLVLKLIMKKNKEVTLFEKNSEKITFKLIKVVSEAEEVLAQVAAPIERVEPKVELIVPEMSNIEVQTTNVEEYRTFDYMDSDDLHETEELLGDLSSLMLMLGSSDIEQSEINQISNYLQGLGKHLTVYTESYAIGQALASLSLEISAHSDRFQEIAAELSTLSGAFISDLQTWFNMTFHQGAPSVDFMDATIVANTQTIASMLSQDEDEDEGNMDDIFDF